MTRDIERRLQKLESQMPPPKPTEEQEIVQNPQRFLRCAIAYYLGDPTSEESIAEAYSRALGYPHMYEFKKALNAKDPDFFERDRSARIKLWEKFGVSRESEQKAIAEAFSRMEAGFSERYKEVSRSKVLG